MMSWRTGRVALAVKAAMVQSGKMIPQAAQFPVFRAKLVTPFRNAVGLVNREVRDGNAPEPFDRVRPCEPFGREVQKPNLSLLCAPDDRGLLLFRQSAIQKRCGDAHLAELCHLILHQGNQGRDHNNGLRGGDCRGQLVAERLPAAGRHNHARIVTAEQAAHNLLLQRAKRVIAPVPPQRGEKIHCGIHPRSIRPESALDHQGFRSDLPWAGRRNFRRETARRRANW